MIELQLFTHVHANNSRAIFCNSNVRSSTNENKIPTDVKIMFTVFLFTVCFHLAGLIPFSQIILIQKNHHASIYHASIYHASIYRVSLFTVCLYLPCVSSYRVFPFSGSNSFSQIILI